MADRLAAGDDRGGGKSLAGAQDGQLAWLGEDSCARKPTPLQFARRHPRSERYLCAREVDRPQITPLAVDARDHKGYRLSVSAAL
jgi:hypothetical protein